MKITNLQAFSANEYNDGQFRVSYVDDDGYNNLLIFHVEKDTGKIGFNMNGSLSVSVSDSVLSARKVLLALLDNAICYLGVK